jgi:acyl-CoA reductase-like NAD-dependent aldehyde dehydrogenase/nicotinamidase-related amidase
MTPLLILVDFQEDFLSTNGLQPHRETLVANANLLLNAFRKRQWKVVHSRITVQRVPDDRMTHWKESEKWLCEVGTPGHAFPELLTPNPQEPVFEKLAFSPWTSPGFSNHVLAEKPDMVVVAGLFTQTCVRETVMGAYERGLRVVLAADAAGSNDPLAAAATMAFLEDRAMPVLGNEELLLQLEFDGPTKLPSPRWNIPQFKPCHSSGNLVMLKDLARTIQCEQETLTATLVEEIKKPLQEARAEVDRCVHLLDSIQSHALNFHKNASLPKSGSQSRRVPHGVVGVITPWNNPLAIPLGKIAAALAYGNTVAWKPSPLSQRISNRLHEMFLEVGFPPAAITMQHGDGRTARTLLNSGVNAVTFSGSSRAGWSILAAATARMLPVQAEMGGNNAVIVCADTNLRDAAQAIARGAFCFAGQRCTAAKRVIVMPGIWERFLDSLREETGRLIWGDPANEGTQVGPLIHWSAVNQMAAVVQRARDGHHLVFQAHGSGSPGPDSYFPPTIICCEEPHAECVQEEHFGPLLVLQKAENFDQALKILNSVRHGLCASLFSDGEANQQAFRDGAQAGLLRINCLPSGAPVSLPFGGWKHSGFGIPEHAEADAQFYTRQQTILIGDIP